MRVLAAKNAKSAKKSAVGRYEKYKPTGIPWLKEVPEGWEVVPFKRFAQVKTNLVSPLEYQDFPQIAPDCIEKGTGNLLSWKTVAQSNVESANHLFKKGQLLYSKIRPLLNKLIIAPFDGLCCADMYPIETSQNILFLKYFMLSKYFLMSVKDVVRDRVKMPKINQEELGSIVVFLPPLDEQRAIVAFLDDKCGKIDELIAAKEAEVKLLGELRERVIADAVTGRSAECAARKYKPTGIPWLKEVPEGWEVVKVSQYFRLRSEKVSEKDFLPLSVAKIGVVPQLADVAVSMAGGDSRKLVRKGDFVVNSRSDRKGSCGIAPRDGSVSTISIVLEPRNIDRGYVHYLFRSTPWVEEFYRQGRGIVADLWTTNYQQMRSMQFPLPPLDEQRRIVDYIEAETAKIDEARAALEKGIAALKEYRERLIADVVTGQRRVHG